MLIAGQSGKRFDSCEDNAERVRESMKKKPAPPLHHLPLHIHPAKHHQYHLTQHQHDCQHQHHDQHRPYHQQRRKPQHHQDQPQHGEHLVAAQQS